MRHARIAVSFAVAALAAAAGAQQPEQHVRGIVASVSGDRVVVKSPDGRAQTTLQLADKTFVAFAAKTDLNAIRKDAFIGTAAVPGPDGTLRALEVHVFPESARGTGEGSRPWDLKPGSSMTNAMVSGVQSDAGKGSAGSSMTNATVSGAESAAGGKKLELTFKGEKKTVVVSPRTPVVALEPADRSAIQAGAHVFAVGPRQPDGSVAAGRVYVGKNGVVPPM
jgi:hypothetical protein